MSKMPQGPQAPQPGTAPADGQKTEPPRLEVSTSRLFLSWLDGMNCSLAFTTYQTGKLFLIGTRIDQESPPTPRGPARKLSIFERSFERVMGLHATSERLCFSTLYQMWFFRNALRPGQTYQEYDTCYVPRTCYVTADIDVHDICIDAAGRVVFVNTLFNCLATLDEDYSFRPIWKPPFISKYAAEDRCHLNGLAMENGRPKYCTAVSRSDVPDGWRDRRGDGGVIIDVESGKIVCSGLSMPHSPRVHNGELYVLNSGAGYFGRVDRSTGEFQPICFCPGYARGLAFHGDYALIGLSDRRENRTFTGLPLDANLKEKDAETRCGLYVVNLRTGDAEHWLRLEGVVRELYDVAFLPGVKCPYLVGFRTDEVRRFITVPPDFEVAPVRQRPPQQQATAPTPGTPVADAGTVDGEVAPVRTDPDGR